MLNNLNQQEVTDLGSSFFIGTVTARIDPLNLRRIKVTIPRLLENSNPDRPWIAPFLSTTITHTNDTGSFNLVPNVGDQVLVGFQQGSLLHGYYFGSAIKANNVPAEFVSPEVYGFKDPSGNTFTINTANNEVKFVHASGTSFTILPSGNISIAAIADVNIDGNVYVTGDVVAGTISLQNHVHGGVVSGSSITSTPL